MHIISTLSIVLTLVATCTVYTDDDLIATASEASTIANPTTGPTRHTRYSVSQGISYLYVTHDGIPNPWDELAKCRAAEVAATRIENETRPSERSNWPTD